MHYEADRHGILYGISYASVEAVVSRSKICVIVCDVDTAMATKDSRRFEELHAVFVRPPTMEALADRLRAMGMDEDLVSHAALGTRRSTPTYVAPPLNFQSKPTNLLPSLSQVVSKTGAAEADLGHGKGPHFDMILANAVIKVG